MNFPSTNPKPCSHLADYRQTHRRRLYRSLSSAAPKPRCGLCSRAASRLYLCLTCSSLSCFDHAMAHSVSDPRHKIAVDIDRLELFCFACADQIYDPDFDSAVDKKIAESDSADRGRKRRAPSDSGKNPASSSGHSLGLRGLSNLGSTCFMNSVLQALLHTPPLRDYFLGDGHNRESCRQKRGRRRMVVGGGEIPCLECDVDVVFSAVFFGDGTPFSPAGFLYSWWRHSANLASYEQQDAHEFFISILDRVHEKEQSSLKNTGIGDCHCIAHRVFSGTLRSDVTCTVCGFTSTTYDPCVDLSLDLESIKPNECSRVSTLVGSLDLFTRPEKLGSDQKLYCQHCRVSQDSVKQMSIRRLPLVLCFHIKRFEHSLIRKSSRKIDRYLQFPFSLDMTPYLSSSIVRSRFGNRIFAEVSSELSSEFEVFAVVTHAGWLESGHYVAYLRLRNQWYKCDDAWITQVSEGTVRSLQVYMIYYVQKVIYDRADEGDVGAKNTRKAVRLGSR